MHEKIKRMIDYLRADAATDDLLCHELDSLILNGLPTERDRGIVTDCRRGNSANLENMWPLISKKYNTNSASVLEIGSRSVVQQSPSKRFIPNSNYIGVDVHDGDNVNLVIDALELSSVFECNSFDAIICFNVLEHISMPWILAEEISKLLKVGGEVYMTTHFSWSEHELPWHFYQYNHLGLRKLFNEELGFKVVDSGMDHPIVGRYSIDSSRAGKPCGGMYCHSHIIAEKLFDKLQRTGSFNWRDCIERFSNENSYPRDTGPLSKKYFL